MCKFRRIPEDVTSFNIIQMPKQARNWQNTTEMKQNNGLGGYTISLIHIVNKVIPLFLRNDSPKYF